MVLTLEISGPQASRLGAASRKTFRASGGTIGRLPTNDWSLPDPYVSNRHALIRFRDGAFFIEDTSTNGVFINGSDTPASLEGAYSLQDGDRLRLGDYEIIVSIDDRNDFSPDASGQVPVSAPGSATSATLPFDALIAMPPMASAAGSGTPDEPPPS